MKSKYSLLCILVVSMISAVPVQSQSANNIPSSVEATQRPVYWGSETHTYLSNSDWSWQRSGNGGIRPNEIYFTQLDLSQIFAGIDFSEVENWEISADDSVEVYDGGGPMEIDIIITYENNDFEFSYNGETDPAIVSCNIIDACEFLYVMDDLHWTFDDKSSFVLPVFPSFSLSIFIITAIILPFYMYHTGRQEHFKKLLRDGLILGIIQIMTYSLVIPLISRNLFTTIATILVTSSLVMTGYYFYTDSKYPKPNIEKEF